MPTAFPSWVPEPARRRLEQLISDPSIRDDDRALIERLATSPVMKTDVWERLPPHPANVQDQVIDWAFVAVVKFSALIPPPFWPGKPVRKEEREKWLKIAATRPPGTTPDFSATLAMSLVRSMYELRSECNSYWDRLWAGDKVVTAEKAIQLVGEIANFFARVQEERNSIIATLPAIKRPYGRNAPEIFFTNMMSSCLERLYGRKLHRVVTALVEVVFDKKEGVEQETIRGRRREAQRRKVAKN